MSDVSTAAVDAAAFQPGIGWSSLMAVIRPSKFSDGVVSFNRAVSAFERNVTFAIDDDPAVIAERG